MKIEHIEDEMVGTEFFDKIRTLEQNVNASFSEKVRLLGLNPETDFRHSNLQYSDFTNSNLEGFDFTGADLRYSAGTGVQVGASTKFDLSELDGSIFSSRVRAERKIESDPAIFEIIRRISGQDVNNKIRWIFDNLYKKSNDVDTYLAAAKILFFSEPEKFGQKEMLRYIIPKLNDNDDIKELLLSAISMFSENSSLIVECFKLARRNKLSRDPELIRILMNFLATDDARIRQAAIKALAAIGNAVQLQTVRQSINGGPPWLGQIYVGEIARRHGEEYQLITNNPANNETFSIDEDVDYTKLYLIARRWLRIENPESEEQRMLPLLNRRQSQRSFSNDEIVGRMSDIVPMLERLNLSGCSFQIL